MTNRSLPIAVIFSAVIVSAAILLIAGGGERKQSLIHVAIAETDPVLGDPNAPVTFVMFEDFECPYCSRFSAQTLPLLVRNEVEAGKVRLVWKDLPLSIHSRAQKAHEAARCAWEQGKFWEYHDALFENPQALDADDLRRHARELGLDEARFTECFDSEKYEALVREKAREAAALGITGTPSFVVNGVLVVGAQPYRVFSEAIADAVAR